MMTQRQQHELASRRAYAARMAKLHATWEREQAYEAAALAQVRSFANDWMRRYDAAKLRCN